MWIGIRADLYFKDISEATKHHKQKNATDPDKLSMSQKANIMYLMRTILPTAFASSKHLYGNREIVEVNIKYLILHKL